MSVSQLNITGELKNIRQIDEDTSRLTVAATLGEGENQRVQYALMEIYAPRVEKLGLEKGQTLSVMGQITGTEVRKGKSLFGAILGNAGRDRSDVIRVPAETPHCATATVAGFTGNTRFFPENGDKGARLLVSVAANVGSGDDQYPVWHTLSINGGRAGALQNAVRSGSCVYAHGDIGLRFYEPEDGEPTAEVQVFVGYDFCDFTFVGRKGAGGGSKGSGSSGGGASQSQGSSSSESEDPFDE